MSTLVLLLLSMAGQGGPAPAMDCQQKTAVYYTAGPRYDQGKRLFPEHARYVTELLRKGTMLAGGPTDEGGGLMIYNSTDAAEVDALTKGDPFVKNGVFTYRQTGWRRCILPAAAR